MTVYYFGQSRWGMKRPAKKLREKSIYYYQLRPIALGIARWAGVADENFDDLRTAVAGIGYDDDIRNFLLAQTVLSGSDIIISLLKALNSDFARVRYLGCVLIGILSKTAPKITFDCSILDALTRTKNDFDMNVRVAATNAVFGCRSAHGGTKNTRI